MASLGQQTSPAADRAVVALEAIVAVVVVAAVIGTSYGPAATVGFLLVGTALSATVLFLWKMIGAIRDPALDVPPARIDEERIALEVEKDILLRGIKELEGDEGTGKVDSADYVALRRAAEQRAMTIIKTLKDSDRKWTEEAEALVAKRTGKSTPKLPDKAPLAPAPVVEAAPAPVLHTDVATAHPGLFAAGFTVLEPTPDGRVRCHSCEALSVADARYCTGCGRPKETA
jgi:hypothetical protein